MAKYQEKQGRRAQRGFAPVFTGSSDPVADAMVVVHRADLVAVVTGGSVGGGGAKDGQGQGGNEEGFHCDLQNG